MKELSNLTDDELKSLYNETKNKIVKYNIIQNTKKTQLNSAYGACGNSYFRFYDVRLAEAITVSGQFIIRWVEKYINEYLNSYLKTKDKDYVIGMDTDSTYINLQSVVDGACESSLVEDRIEFLDQFTKNQLQPCINACFDRLAEYMNVYANKISMKREILASRGFWTRKKRYALSVYDSEGVRYKEPKIKIVGLDSVRSSTAVGCRPKLKELTKLILQTDEETVMDYIQSFKDDFAKMSLDDIAIPCGMNNLKKYSDPNKIFIKGSPVQVKAALIYNAKLRERGVELKYPPIVDGTKGKYVFLKKPNPIFEAVVAYNEMLPPEFLLQDYIDRDRLFERGFLKPTKTILDSIGWKVERTRTLSEFISYD
jgi:DNA polymerase elongation subunit (family B)